MLIYKNMKNIAATSLLPLARLYIRYSPFYLFKQFLWERFYWREHNYVARTLVGTMMKGNSLDLVQGFIYYFGIWEPNLTAFIKKRLQCLQGRTFVDVGANVGYFSLLVAYQLAQVKVVAIEAFPSIYERLVDNVKLNGLTNIRTVAVAATENKQQVFMYHSGKNNEGATTSVRGKFQTEPMVVEGLPLSEILTEVEIEQVRLIKIDVEGAEYSVIKGMSSLLSRFQKDIEIIVEITPESIGEKNLAEIFDMFEMVGFYPYILTNIYDVEYYLFSQATSTITRMKEIPKKQTDVIFSRTNAEFI